jgi:hypothetical protein
MSLLKPARLRVAWTESVRAMCQIIAYYLEACGDPRLNNAFRWTAESIPPAGKKWTVAFVMAMTLILLSSACAGASVLMWGLTTGGLWSVGGLAAGLLTYAGQLPVWLRGCRDAG